MEGKTIDVPLPPAGATDSLDGLAKEIYCRVFDWLVAKINDSTRCAKGAVKGTIDLLVSCLGRGGGGVSGGGGCGCRGAWYDAVGIVWRNTSYGWRLIIFGLMGLFHRGTRL